MKIKGLRFKEDYIIRFRDWNDEFDHLEVKIKKGTEVEASWVETFQCYRCEFYLNGELEETERNFEIRIIQESENDWNDVNGYLNDFISFEVRELDKVEEIEIEI